MAQIPSDELKHNNNIKKGVYELKENEISPKNDKSSDEIQNIIPRRKNYRRIRRKSAPIRNLIPRRANNGPVEGIADYITSSDEQVINHRRELNVSDHSLYTISIRNDITSISCADPNPQAREKINFSFDFNESLANRTKIIEKYKMMYIKVAVINIMIKEIKLIPDLNTKIKINMFDDTKFVIILNQKLLFTGIFLFNGKTLLIKFAKGFDFFRPQVIQQGEPTQTESFEF